MTRFPWLAKIERLFWILFWVTLPVTSFPYFPSGLGGRNLVRPLTLYPLLILLPFSVLPRWWKRPAPRTLLPLLAFIIVALASTALSMLRGIDSAAMGFSVPDRALRTLISLFLGVAFYFTVALMPQNLADLRFALRWLYAGFMIALAWGSLQVIYVIHFNPAYFNLLKQLQSLVSIRRLFPARVSGLTYEPNWFAEQITFLLLPWLFTAVFMGYSVFRWRWRCLTVELLLLAWAAMVLIFTYSRSGLILLGMQLFIMLLLRPRKAPGNLRLKTLGKRLLQASLALVVLAGIVFFAGARNNYFSRLWNYWTDEESNRTYLQYIAFDQRFTYWGTAYRVYADYPLLGVGLGNFTYYFEEYLPNRPLYPTPELLSLVTPEAGRSLVTTVKGLFPRLLAETGLLGMACFVAFLLAILGGALFLALSPDREAQFWGRAGLLALIVFTAVSFSYDSFSLPNMWVIFGFITAAAHIFSASEP